MPTEPVSENNINDPSGISLLSVPRASFFFLSVAEKKKTAGQNSFTLRVAFFFEGGWNNTSNLLFPYSQF